jgi:hypothetical protein
MPVRVIDFSGKHEKEKHAQMASLFKRMLDLHKRLVKATHPDDTTRLQRRIDASDREIDNLVYDLYGLTEEEIKIVEEGAEGRARTSSQVEACHARE